VRFVSTRGACASADLAHALLGGTAPDGGLWMPERIPTLPPSFFVSLPGRPLADTATAVLAPYFEELPETELRALVADALSFPIPLVPLGPRARLLELFRGPTLAFKDVGARVLARLLSWTGRGADGAITVLVATSGDTGGAVAAAFHGVPRTRVVVLYPEGRISAVQQAQFATLGGNVQALAVAGTFDDCQRLAMAAFADEDLQHRVQFASANSISIGRLLPQMVYYFHALAQLPAAAPPVLFATPSGNFGNLCAGLVAKRMGLPVAGYVAATNANDVVPEYLETGLFRPRPSVPTISNAMDVGNPSNFERIRWLYGRDRGAIRADVRGSSHGDDATRAAIRRVHDDTGVVLDPHTAVGWLGLVEAMADAGDVTGIVLGTAHPAKFREEVEPVLGDEIALPSRLAACLERPDLSVRIAPDLAALRAMLVHEPEGRFDQS
jgi:threonine synthase